MTKIIEFENQNITITWTLLLIGYKSEYAYSNELLSSDIIDYSIEIFEKFVNNELISSLIVADNEVEFYTCLKKLSEEEKVDLEFELRKWRAIKISQLLNMNFSDQLELIMNLSDFWLSIETPCDIPIEIQGVNNNVSPDLYYTSDNIKNIIEAQRKWLANEMISLKN